MANPRNPEWHNRDRFVLSAGHGSMLLYSLMHLFKYPTMSMEEIKQFRQLGSQTPGHPEFNHTPGVEATTGPLGQGASNAVGMALSEAMLAARLNKEGTNFIDHFTYALVSDGDLMEGVSAEAASLAGHLGLGKLIYLYDSNDISLDGPTTLAFSTENVAKRYEAYGWQVLLVENGDTDLTAIDLAIRDAKTEKNKPSLIIVKSTIGFGSDKAGTSAVHGAPLKGDEIAATRKKLDWPLAEKFSIPNSVYEHIDLRLDECARVNEAWDGEIKKICPDGSNFENNWNHYFEPDYKLVDFSKINFDESTPLATRQASGVAINTASSFLPNFVGGDADLSCSTNTRIENSSSVKMGDFKGKNLHFGVREHAMSAIQNGMLYHGGLRPFVSTFFCFFDYMKPAVRLAAMNNLPAIYVFTHDSVGLGEDGPTHQPVEHLAALRAIPNVNVIRPFDAYETIHAWRVALECTDRPTAIVLSRQKLPIADSSLRTSFAEFSNGAYRLKGESDSRVVIGATGSEVWLALDVQALLSKRGISSQVVSIPSWELFEKQSTKKMEELFPKSALRVAIEAGSKFGWERFIGRDGLFFGVNRFGISAPADDIYSEIGLNAIAIEEKIATLLKS